MNDLALVFPPSRAITLIARCIYLAALVVAIFGEILACMHIHSIWGTPATLFAIFVFPVAPMVPIFSSGHWIPAAMTYGAFIAAYILCSIVFFVDLRKRHRELRQFNAMSRLITLGLAESKSVKPEFEYVASKTSLEMGSRVYMMAIGFVVWGEVLAFLHTQALWGTSTAILTLFVFPVAPLIPVFSTGQWFPAAVTYGSLAAALAASFAVYKLDFSRQLSQHRVLTRLAFVRRPCDAPPEKRRPG